MADSSTSLEVKPSKPRTPLIIGALMLLGGVLLVAYFISEPMGTLPYLPTTLRGGPAMLGGTFLCVCGAFLVLLRRFSLSIFLVGAIASGGMAALTERELNSMTEPEDYHVSLPADLIAQRGISEAVGRATRLIDAAAREGFLRDVQVISVRLERTGKDEAKLVFKKRNRTRQFWWGNDRDLVRDYISVAYLAYGSERIHIQLSESAFPYELLVLAQNLAADEPTSQSGREDTLLDRLKWLHDWEPDPKIKEFLAGHIKTISEKIGRHD